MGRQVKCAPVDLPAAGILRTDDGALARQAVGQRSHRGDARAGDLAGQGQPLGDGQPDAQPGKAAGTVGHGVQIQLGGGQAAGFQGGIHHGQQGLAVG